MIIMPPRKYPSLSKRVEELIQSRVGALDRFFSSKNQSESSWLLIEDLENQEHEDLVNEENEDLVKDNEDRSAHIQNEDPNIVCETINIYEISNWDKMDQS